MKKNMISYLCLVLMVTACNTTKKSISTDDKKIDIIFLQVNDVYEIAPLEAGTSGGFARVATLKKETLKTNPNTFLVMAGDFLSPSVYNSLKYEGKRIRGRQMIETMNTAGMDIAIYGNHEFDITEDELQSRLNESTFQWISSNSFHKKGARILPFACSSFNKITPIPETYVLSVKDADGTTARIGFFSATLPFNKATYVSYTDPLATSLKMYKQLQDSSVDAIIAITHQAMADDIILAQRLPGLAMIIGGHEHDRRFQKVGTVLISKAHANAKSVYKLDLSINKLSGAVNVTADLKIIDSKVALDTETDQVVKKWTAIADSNYAAIGFQPSRILMTKGDPLEGREIEIRSKPTNLSRLIVKAMEAAAPLSEIAIVNTGSIRLDDVLNMPVTEYDILRTLPFGGSIVEVDMKGALLKNILQTGARNRGIGGYLVYSSKMVVDTTLNTFLLSGKPINDSQTYRVALTDFLLTGGEANLDYLNLNNPSITKLYPVATGLSDARFDIRLAIVRYLESLK